MVGMGDEAQAPFAPDPVDVELRGNVLFVFVRENRGEVTGNERFVDPEGEVMIEAGRHLDADEEMDAVIGSFIAVIPGLEPVVVGEHDKVDAVGPCRLDNLED